MCIICRNKNIQKTGIICCSRVEKIENSNVKVLNIRKNNKIKEIKNLNLRYLYLKNTNIEDISNLDKLETLIIINCQKINKLDSFPSLKKLVLINTDIDNIPIFTTLEMLYIKNAKKLENIYSFPNLKILTISGTLIKSIPYYPKLKKLELYNPLDSITYIPTLKELILYNFSLQSLPPFNLDVYRISNNYIPCNSKNLIIYSCNNIQNLELDCIDNLRIHHSSLKNLYIKNVKNMDIRYCSYLKTIISNFIGNINIIHSPNLEIIQSDKLYNANIYYCDKLMNIPEIINLFFVYCKWLENENIKRVIKLQKFFRQTLNNLLKSKFHFYQ